MSYTWDADAGALLALGSRGVVRVLGGPGTGKSSLLIDAAVAQIDAGVDPESVLLLTGSGRIGTARAQRPDDGVAALAIHRPRPAAVSEPLVRTVHGYAYAVLRRAAERAGEAPPRLVTSAEQDAIIRELLAGDLEDGPRAATAWPAAAAARAEHRRLRHRTAKPVGALRRTRRGSRRTWSGWAVVAGGRSGPPPANSRASTSR